MSNSQEQMKDIINNLRAGKTDKEVFAKRFKRMSTALFILFLGKTIRKYRRGQLLIFALRLIRLMWIRI